MLPNTDLFVKDMQLGESRGGSTHNDTVTLHPCLEWDGNCGEGGCVFNDTTGQVYCLCPDSHTQPDEHGRCADSVVQPIGPSHTPNKPEIPGFPYYPVHRTSIVKPNSTEATSSEHGVNVDASPTYKVDIASVAIPVGILLIMLITMVIVIVFLRKSSLRRHANAERNETNVHKQDRSHLLDDMMVIGQNMNYAVCGDLYSKLNALQVKRICREQLTLMEEIGEGAFGKVYRGEVQWTNDRPTFVAVKILKQDASMEAQTDFLREVQIMCSFHHDNILSLLGIVSLDNASPFMVFELMEHGDLTELLRKSDPREHVSNYLQLKKTDLVDIATQIANGMCYLAEQHFVHRDLATRNCLVGAELLVKISDFGMSRDIYTCDYYKIGGTRLLPVRWMSPEAIKYGRFTSESDVWSFGVTLWEIFTYGKQPYYGHANEEVIRLLDDGILLQKPDHCPDEVFSIMLACWRTDIKQRFTFKRIYQHLQDINNRRVTCYQQRTHSMHGDVSIQLHPV